MYQPVQAAQAALDANHRIMRLEDGNPPSTALFHLLVSLIEWSDAQNPRVDFDAVLSQVREHFAESGMPCARLRAILENLAESNPNSASVDGEFTAEAAAWNDLDAVKGKVIAVGWVGGYPGESEDSGEWHADEAGLLRVIVTGAERCDVINWTTDEDLDPRWNVIPAPGETRLADIRSMWVHGRSFRVLSEEAKALVLPPAEPPVTIPERVREGLRWIILQGVESSTERLPHLAPDDARCELTDVEAVVAWFGEVGGEVKDITAAMLDDAEADRIRYSQEAILAPLREKALEALGTVERLNNEFCRARDNGLNLLSQTIDKAVQMANSYAYETQHALVRASGVEANYAVPDTAEHADNMAAIAALLYEGQANAEQIRKFCA